jgi:hypothetical protein
MSFHEQAVQFLDDLGRGDLARLLERTRWEVVDPSPDDWDSKGKIHLYAPAPYDEALRGLNENDKARIAETLKRHDPAAAQAQTGFDVHVDGTIKLSPEEQLLGDVVCEFNMLIDVGTGGARFNSVDDYYRARRKRVRQQLVAIGIDDPNPFPSLWDWHRQWPGSYAGRREAVRKMYQPVLERLCTRTEEPSPAREPTGWLRVDRTLEKARLRLNTATKEEDFQSIGLLCREALISLGQAVFDSSKHPSTDGVKVSETDAKRMLEAYFAAELRGGDLEATRKHARAALDLAVTLQHKRTADFRFGALCLEATASTVNIVAIICGRRSRPRLVLDAKSGGWGGLKTCW